MNELAAIGALALAGGVVWLIAKGKLGKLPGALLAAALLVLAGLASWRPRKDPAASPPIPLGPPPPEPPRQLQLDLLDARVERTDRKVHEITTRDEPRAGSDALDPELADWLSSESSS